MEYYQALFQAMGTTCEIQLYAKTHEQAKQIADSAIADVLRLEALYSRYRSDSVIAKINAVAAQGGTIQVDSETASLLNYANTCYEQSEGLFDITSGILRYAWRFESNRLPSKAQIETLLTKIGWHKVRWHNSELTFSTPGMELDFGGIVKEYAVDRVAAMCRSSGIRHGLINLGGDIKVIGPQADGAPWCIGIRHPRRPDELFRSLYLTEGALASSGDYARCITLDGVRYSHILNPKTGWPVSHLASVSVVGDFCVVAGSASTIAMLKEEDGITWLTGMGLPFLWMDVHENCGESLLQ